MVTNVRSSNLVLLIDIASKNGEQIFALKRFLDCLDSCYAGLLEEKGELVAAPKFFKVILCLFHGLSTLEHGFTVDDYKSSQSHKTLRMIHHIMRVHNITITKDLTESVNESRKEVAVSQNV